jgi:hypothetical protein
MGQREIISLLDIPLLFQEAQEEIYFEEKELDLF